MPRSLFLALALGLIALCNAFPGAAQAQEYPWCVTSADGLFDCSYVTYQQCLATASGIGGCVQNPRAVLEPVYPDQFSPRSRFGDRPIR
jgi:hypothetical protein